MSLPAYHLLSLPRELRDQIYEYLRHEVSFNWKWKYSGRSRVQIHVKVPHAPRLSVLLVCSRMHQEMRSVHLAKSYMGLHWDGLCIKPRYAWSITKTPKYAKAFNTVMDVRLVIDNDVYNPPWTTTAKLVKVAKRHIPYLASITVSTKSCMGHIYVLVPLANHRSIESQPAPDKIAGFHIMQLGRSLGVEYEQDPFFTRPPRSRVYYEPSLRHRVNEFHIYLYIKGSHPVRLMTQKDVESLWPLREYPDKFLENLEAEDMQMIERFSTRMWGWEALKEDQLALSKGIVCVKEEVTMRKVLQIMKGSRAGLMKRCS
jgi:hypothetical protein